MIITNDEPVWTSKTNPIAIILLMFPISIGLFCLISDWDTNFLSEKYLPLDNGIVLIFAILLISALIYLIYIKLMPVYKLYEDRLVILSKRKPEETFYLLDMERWRYAESLTKSGSIDTNSVSFYFNNKKLSLSIYLISNLNALRNWMIKNHPDPEAKTKKNGVTNFMFSLVIGVLLIGSILLMFSFQNNLNRNKGFDTINLGRLVLSDSPEFISHSHKGSATTYEMRLKTREIKDFELEIKNIGHSDDKISIEQSLHKNDTIDVSILQYDYDVKIAKTKDPSFWDKHFGWHSIKIKHIHSAGIYF